jgi:DNA primase
MSKFDELLNRLDGVRKADKGNYICRCPAHDDRMASLTIKEADDGRVLLNCFAGCGALQILNSIGMDWDALFPDTRETLRPVKQRISSRAAFEQMSLESTIVFHYAKMIKAGEEVDMARLNDSIANIERVRNLMGFI